MSFQRMSHSTTVEYDVTDEPVMRSLLGPDAMMLPFQARVEITGGELAQVIVFGWQILKSGKAGRSTAVTRFRADDLDQAPEWVRPLVADATARVQA